MADLASSAHKLEPFVLMCKSAKGAGAAKLIENVTSASGVFVFGELLEHPNIQELASNPLHAPYLELLKLFAYGTYEDYKLHKDALPSLNPAQLVKLKKLSIVSLASESRILSYAQLRSYLDINTLRELEDIIIDAMYQDVLRGRLDQKEQQLELEYTMGRDLRPGQLEQLLAALKNWSEQTSQVIDALDTKITQIEAHHEQQKLDGEAFHYHRNNVLVDMATQRKLSKRPGLMDSDEMDIDSTAPMAIGLNGSSGVGFLGGLMGGDSWRKKKPASTSQSSTNAPASPSNTRKRNRN